MYRRIAWIGLWLTAVAAHAQGVPAGETPLQPAYYTCVKAARGVTIALNDCIGNEYGFQDMRLNAAYQRLRKRLSPDKQVALRDEERAWIAERDKACAPDDGGGTVSLLDRNQCQLDQTAARASVLEERTK
jgi:uncharacterized protein YecT (DUF1311 family)